MTVEPSSPSPLAQRRHAGVRPVLLTALVLAGLLAGVLLTVLAAWLIEGGRGPVAVPTSGGRGPDLTISFSRELLEQLMAESARRADSPVRLTDVRVITANGVLALQGDVETPVRIEVPASIELQPVPLAGKLRFRVLHARIGPLPIPGDLERLAEAPLNSRIEAATRGLPADVIAARADADGLTVVARVRVAELPTPTPRPTR